MFSACTATPPATDTAVTPTRLQTTAAATQAAPPTDPVEVAAGRKVYDTFCSVCHSGADDTAPELATLHSFNRERVSTALSDKGLMALQSKMLNPEQRAQVISFITTPEDLRGHSFVSYVDDLLFSKELQILDELHRPGHFALRSTSVLAQFEAVRAGAGLAVLPAFVAAQDPALQPVLPGQARFTRTFWMSMPAENKHVARMQATWAYLREAVGQRQGVLNPA